MTPPPAMVQRLKGTTAGGSASAEVVAVKAVGPVRRTIGLHGDGLSLNVPAFTSAGAQVWPPSDWDLSKPMTYEFGLEGSTIELGGYLLVGAEPLAMGVSEPDHSSSGDVVPNIYALSLLTKVGVWRDGRGGRLTVGDRNVINNAGEVVDTHPSYRIHSELVAECVSAMGLTLGTMDASIDDFAPPGPLDWGNARAIDELEGVLSRIGFAAVLSLDGGSINIIRLPQAGADQTLPVIGDAPDFAEPYELGTHRAVRGKTIVVSSGRTRTIIVSDHELSDFEWVAYDERTGTWGNAAEWASAYPGEIGPADIDKYREGPPKDARARAQWMRLYGALRLNTEEVWYAKRRIAPLPIKTGAGEDAMSKVGAIVYGRGLVDRGSNIMANDPLEASPVKRFDGARAHSPDGVIELPTSAEWVKITGQDIGTREHAVELGGEDITVRFAHEANEDDRLVNYYWRGFSAAVVDGEIELAPITDPSLLGAAIDDPETLVIEAPFLQRVMVWPVGDPAPSDEPTNQATLDELAQELATARAAAEGASSGIVELRGLQAKAPGAYDGGATSITWDIERLRTIVDLNAHEAPQAWYDQLAERASRSLAAGLGRFNPPASSASMSDVRAGSTPGEAFVAGLAGGAPTGAGGAATRGAEDRVAIGPGLVSPQAPAPRQAPQSLIARITGATSIGTNKWRYEWESIAFDNTTPLAYTASANKRTHTTDGYAYNGLEGPNSGSGVQGNGIDVGNLTGTFALKPIGVGAIVELRGPLTTGTPWIFWAPNQVDGECS